MKILINAHLLYHFRFLSVWLAPDKALEFKSPPGDRGAVTWGKLFSTLGFYI